MQVVGVDGCPGGWIAVVWDTDTDTWEPRFHQTFSAIVECYPDAACIGIDIPIGLRDDCDARRCDTRARKLLGWPRMASVFPAPQRSLLSCTSHAEASAQSRACFGKGVSQQAFGIYAKVYEVDQVMTPGLQSRIIELHPEVTFRAMNGDQPMALSKKKTAGFECRRNLLADWMPPDIPKSRADARKRAPYAGADDLLDALAAAWTARRCASGDAIRLPDQPEINNRGLRMEIVY